MQRKKKCFLAFGSSQNLTCECETDCYVSWGIPKTFWNVQEIGRGNLFFTFLCVRNNAVYTNDFMLIIYIIIIRKRSPPLVDLCCGTLEAFWGPTCVQFPQLLSYLFLDLSDANETNFQLKGLWTFIGLISNIKEKNPKKTKATQLSWVCWYVLHG